MKNKWKDRGKKIIIDKNLPILFNMKHINISLFIKNINIIRIVYDKFQHLSISIILFSTIINWHFLQIRIIFCTFNQIYRIVESSKKFLIGKEDVRIKSGSHCYSLCIYSALSSYLLDIISRSHCF